MFIVETSVFTRQVSKLLTDDEYRELQTVLINRPTAGQVIVGSGGLRKIRWTMRGKGKRGGVRVIYYWIDLQERVLMPYIYPKSERDDLSQSQLKALRKIVEGEYP